MMKSYEYLCVVFFFWIEFAFEVAFEKRNVTI